ncbi:MAG: TetR/AcrR family transcriptional regulator, partial [Pseudomonadota bacterium]
YNYFKSKEEVIEALAEDSILRFKPILKRVGAEASSFEEYLRGAFRAYFRFIAKENQPLIESGGAHALMASVRIDTPEIKAVADEIRADVERVVNEENGRRIDTGYLTAAAIGIAREMGDAMLLRRPVDPDATAEFAAALVLRGVGGLPPEPC